MDKKLEEVNEALALPGLEKKRIQLNIFFFKQKMLLCIQSYKSTIQGVRHVKRGTMVNSSCWYFVLKFINVTNLFYYSALCLGFYPKWSKFVKAAHLDRNKWRRKEKNIFWGKNYKIFQEIKFHFFITICQTWAPPCH